MDFDSFFGARVGVLHTAFARIGWMGPFGFSLRPSKIVVTRQSRSTNYANVDISGHSRTRVFSSKSL